MSAGGHPVVHDLHDLLGDRHLDAVRAAQLEDRQAGLHALAGLLGDRDRLVDGQALAEVLAERAVARQRRGAGGDEVAHAGQAQEGHRVGAERDAQARHLRQPAGDQRGLRVRAVAQARRPCRWPAR